jgi:hypothetical protein
MKNNKREIDLYLLIMIIVLSMFFSTFFMYVREYNKNHIDDSYWSRKYDSLLNENKVDASDTIRLQ